MHALPWRHLIAPHNTLLALSFNKCLPRRTRWPLHIEKGEIWRHSSHRTNGKILENYFCAKVSTQAYNVGQGETLQLKVSASASPCQVKSRIFPALLCREDSQKENELLARIFLKSAKRSHHTKGEFCGIPQPTIASLAQTRPLQGLQRRWKLRHRESAPGNVTGWSRGDLRALQTLFWRRRDLSSCAWEPAGDKCLVLHNCSTASSWQITLWFCNYIWFCSSPDVVCTRNKPWWNQGRAPIALRRMIGAVLQVLN